ncbi:MULTISPECIES: hypothetical protein [unclassified Modicisalibacter]|uniref:hypothetical protein n=1 Tax=unclassified Modicisalibacter TaxID=2679913 RepID=UPI001CCAA7D7|nr:MULTISPECIES: hypothetical protein [unclassified Modicisalibacter]MBZ9559074.1 hypothetical protein [Modicisalibacter sp. R2A 31.J]MBZ9576815.1 hypothetical protein [Modicisalibacter sp. MOD 31.J]
MKMSRRWLLAVLATLALPSLVEARDGLYYEIGGAAPFEASAGLGHTPRPRALGIRWDVDATCGNFDLGATVSNQLNGVTRGFEDMMGNVVSNATGAVASLPAMIIQRANPGLYDLLTNGVLQGRLDFDKSKLSCQRMSRELADATLGGRMQKAAMAENWQDIAASNTDAVAAQEEAEAQAGNAGRTWVGGQKRGGQGQEPVRVVEDTAKAGYNLLHGRTDTTSEAPVSGGGGGWGSVSTSNGDWVGGGGIAGGGGMGGGGTGSGSDCQGGMCTLWGTPEAAAEWTRKIVGDTEIRTCDGCDKTASIAGTGLIRELEDEQKAIHEHLVDMLNGGAITQSKLNAVSAGNGLAVSRGVIEAMRADPQGPLLAQRLASEMALARTLTKAMWARRTLIAGTSDPGIENNEEGMSALDRKLQAFNRDIELLKSEMEIRQSLASNAAMQALRRAANRASGTSPDETALPQPRLDERGRPIQEASE